MTELGKRAKLGILGCGSWGCTMAQMLHRSGLEVTIWGHTPELIEKLREFRHPVGVPEVLLPEDLVMGSDLGAMTEGCDAVVLVVASQAIAIVAEQLAALPSPPKRVIIASKGLDQKTLQPLSVVVAKHLPNSEIIAVSGPCIAREVARGIPTSVVSACDNMETAQLVQQWFSTRTFRVYAYDDLLGVELGGALKNVIAIAAGVSDGLGFGANSKSALLSRGLAEMRRVAVAMGARDVTITGLAGLGDLCVTCFSPHSRNRRFGEALALGESPKEILAEMGEVVEGITTAEAVLRVAEEKGIEVPIAEAVVKLVRQEWLPQEAVEKLMTRDLKSEF